MPEDMSSWRSLASVASRSIKGYVVQRDPRKVVAVPTDQKRPDGQPVNIYSKQSWGQWAGQKIRDLRQPNEEAASNAVEKLSLFPGWAVRKYRKPEEQGYDRMFTITSSWPARLTARSSSRLPSRGIRVRLCFALHRGGIWDTYRKGIPTARER